jgi:hypothetical protein
MTKKIQQTEFAFHSLRREDLRRCGFDSTKVSDRTMQKLANELKKTLCQYMIYDLLYNAKRLRIPKLRRKRLQEKL